MQNGIIFEKFFKIWSYVGSNWSLVGFRLELEFIFIHFKDGFYYIMLFSTMLLLLFGCSLLPISL